MCARILRHIKISVALPFEFYTVAHTVIGRNIDRRLILPKEQDKTALAFRRGDLQGICLVLFQVPVHLAAVSQPCFPDDHRPVRRLDKELHLQCALHSGKFPHTPAGLRRFHGKRFLFIFPFQLARILRIADLAPIVLHSFWKRPLLAVLDLLQQLTKYL